jgi:hypothetical protein
LHDYYHLKWEDSSFWSSPWLSGAKYNDIAPLIYEASTRNKCKVNQALLVNAWVAKIKMDANLTAQHIHEYITLWAQLQRIQLVDHIEDTITWNTTTNGEYCSTAAYKAQFFGSMATNMNKLVWKNWAPQRLSYLLGWHSTIGFGWRIVLRGGVGIILAYARFATKPKKRWLTYSPIVVTLNAFGEW